MKRIFLLIIAFGVALVLIVACALSETPLTEAPSEEIEIVEEADNGEALIGSKCTDCHSTDRVFRANKTEAEWETTIDRMIGLGANVTDEEKAEMIDWLVSREN